MTANDTATTPASIRQQGPMALSVTWGDGHESVFEVRALRLACGCAVCIDEWTGEGRLDPTSVPEDVRPVQIRPVGRYGVQIDWSDGHASGIHPFTRLRASCPCPDCRGA